MKKIFLQKAKSQIARTNTIRDINKQIVLNYVRDRAPISRAEIARETALQRSTVSAIVDDLQFENLIEEVGMGDSTGGRKPTMLKLKTDVPVAIGVDITPRETTIAVCDLGGQILQKESFETIANSDQMTDRIITAVKKYVQKNKHYKLNVGISVPGIANQVTGNVVYVPYFDWRNWDICQQIAEQTGVQATVDNDANAIAMAELWFGEERNRKHRNFISVLVGEGIGTGIIFDGQIYRGDGGGAGEFGHMVIGEDAQVRCSCGNLNCWEAHASEGAMITRYINKGGKKVGKGNSISIEELIRSAEDGDERAIEVFKETARYIGIGIYNLIIGFSPQAIIVSGRIVKIWDIIKGEIECQADRSVRHELPKILIQASSLGDSPTLIGSLSLVLAQKFASAN